MQNIKIKRKLPQEKGRMSFNTLALCLAIKNQIMDVFRGIFKDAKLCCIIIVTPFFIS